MRITDTPPLEVSGAYRPPTKQAGCENIYIEKASGAHHDRPQLKAALDYARRGAHCSRLEAFSACPFTQAGHSDRSGHAQSGYQSESPHAEYGYQYTEGRLFFHMIAAFDEFQRELIIENTKAGLASARKRGRRGSRPRALDEKKIKNAEAMLKDVENYPIVGDIIDQLNIGRTAFYRYFPPDRIRELRNTNASIGH